MIFLNIIELVISYMISCSARFQMNLSNNKDVCTRGLPSPWAAQTLPMLMAGVAATCMRSTIGSGCLGAASRVWVVSQWQRLQSA